VTSGSWKKKVDPAFPIFIRSFLKKLEEVKCPSNKGYVYTSGKQFEELESGMLPVPALNDPQRPETFLELRQGGNANLTLQCHLLPLIPASQFFFKRARDQVVDTSSASLFLNRYNQMRKRLVPHDAHSSGYCRTFRVVCYAYRVRLCPKAQDQK
jgi:hypothetical protein